MKWTVCKTVTEYHFFNVDADSEEEARKRADEHQCWSENVSHTDTEVLTVKEVKKATEYAVLVWDFKPEDFPSLGCPCREINVDTLSEAIAFYDEEIDVFAKELHHYYEVDTKEWESSSNCLMSWDAEEEE